MREIPEKMKIIVLMQGTEGSDRMSTAQYFVNQTKAKFGKAKLCTNAQDAVDTLQGGIHNIVIVVDGSMTEPEQMVPYVDLSRRVNAFLMGFNVFNNEEPLHKQTPRFMGPPVMLYPKAGLYLSFIQQEKVIALATKDCPIYEIENGTFIIKGADASVLDKIVSILTEAKNPVMR